VEPWSLILKTWRLTLESYVLIFEPNGPELRIEDHHKAVKALPKEDYGSKNFGNSWMSSIIRDNRNSMDSLL
jgi:hypothetical protein